MPKRLARCLPNSWRCGHETRYTYSVWRGPEASLGSRGEAVRFYRELLDIWRNADADLPALKEAQDYVQQHGAQ